MPEPSGPSAGRVLLAEDDREFRRLIAKTLRNDGYEVVEADDGVALLEQYASALLADGDLNDVFDLIVTDVRMPGWTGLTILDGLRSAGCNTPAIVMTAFGSDALRAGASRLGAVVIDKPFDLDELRQAIFAQFGRRDSGVFIERE